MALPADGQNANDLTKVTEIPAGKELIFFDPTTNEGGIITLENLTKQILNGLTKQTFALDAGQQTILQALNTLNSESLHVIFIGEQNNDFEWAKNYWHAIPESSCVKFVYNSVGTEYFYIFIKRINAHGLVLRFSYDAPVIEMIRFSNKECMNDGEKFDVIK